MTDELMNLWKFDDADLGANRLGKLTAKQSTFLAVEHKSQRGVFLGVGGLVVVIFCCSPILIFGVRSLLPLLLAGDLSSLTEMVPSVATGGIALGIVASIALPIAVVVVIYLIRANKKSDVTVKRTEGKVTYTWGTKRVRTPGNSTRSYEDVRVLHLNLGDKKFEVKEQLQGMIKEGEEWTVYYTAYPFKFLSAEPMTKAA